MSEVVYAINLDADGQLVSVTKDGVEGKEYAEGTKYNLPEETPKTIAQEGPDPANGKGIELLEYPNGLRCVHYFCRRICW